MRGLHVLHLDGLPVTDAHLAKLAALTELREVSFGATLVTEAGLGPLAGLKRLRRLNLSGMPVTGRGLGLLAGLAELEELHLMSRTHEAVSPLARLRQLRELWVVNNGLDEGNWAALYRALPDCSIPGRQRR